jgi:hypothetical protein
MGRVPQRPGGRHNNYRGSKEYCQVPKANVQRHSYFKTLAETASGAGTLLAAELKLAVRSFPPLKFTTRDCAEKMGPHGIPHQPKTIVSKLQGNPLLTAFSPAGMK